MASLILVQRIPSELFGELGFTSPAPESDGKGGEGRKEELSLLPEPGLMIVMMMITMMMMEDKWAFTASKTLSVSWFMKYCFYYFNFLDFFLVKIMMMFIPRGLMLLMLWCPPWKWDHAEIVLKYSFLRPWDVLKFVWPSTWRELCWRKRGTPECGGTVMLLGFRLLGFFYFCFVLCICIFVFVIWI